MYSQLYSPLDLNLLDWGGNDKIAVGLGTLVYLYSTGNDHIEELFYNATTVCPTSLKWNRHDSNILAVGTSDCQIQVSILDMVSVCRIMIMLMVICVSLDMFEV